MAKMEKSGAAQQHGETNSSPIKHAGNRAILINSALDMSWRLAIAVLVPIIGGFELDKHFNTAPFLTIVGFLLSMTGLFFILKRTVAIADEKYRVRTKR